MVLSNAQVMVLAVDLGLAVSIRSHINGHEYEMGILSPSTRKGGDADLIARALPEDVEATDRGEDKERTHKERTHTDVEAVSLDGEAFLALMREAA